MCEMCHVSDPFGSMRKWQHCWLFTSNPRGNELWITRYACLSVGFYWFYFVIWLSLCWCTDMRKPYNDISDQFGVKDLITKEPFGNFEHWLEQACSCSSVYEPNAMTIATATSSVVLDCVTMRNMWAIARQYTCSVVCMSVCLYFFLGHNR